jgi:anti-anti-sigma regulatory factor
MDIKVSTQTGRVPITILQMNGNLDASNYTVAIQKAEELYAGGVRDIVIDLSNVPYLSSAGLMAMHTMALIFSGGLSASTESRRPSFRSVAPERAQAIREHIKLLNPQPLVDQVLDVAGLKNFFVVFKDLDTAVKSF